MRSWARVGEDDGPTTKSSLSSLASGGFACGRAPFLESVPLSDTSAAQSQGVSPRGAGGWWGFSFPLEELPPLTSGIAIVVDGAVAPRCPAFRRLRGVSLAFSL